MFHTVLIEVRHVFHTVLMGFNTNYIILIWRHNLLVHSLIECTVSLKSTDSGASCLYIVLLEVHHVITQF